MSSPEQVQASAHLIEKLAELVGFHQSYVDSYGKEVFAKDDARESLLKAMGYDLSSDAVIEPQIKQLSEQAWRKMLPATHIAKCEEHEHLLVISVKTTANDKITWTITTEAGQVSKEELILSTLPKVDETHLDGEYFAKYQLALPTL